MFYRKKTNWGVVGSLTMALLQITYM